MKHYQDFSFKFLQNERASSANHNVVLVQHTKTFSNHGDQRGTQGDPQKGWRGDGYQAGKFRNFGVGIEF